MQSAARFLGVSILVGHSQVSGFGTMPKVKTIPDLSQFDGVIVDTKAEQNDAGESKVEEVINEQKAAGWPFCVEMGTGIGQYTYLGKFSEIGKKSYCNTIRTEAECGYGDKVFRTSDNSDDKFDVCAWNPKMRDGKGKCAMARYTYECGQACLSYTGAASIEEEEEEEEESSCSAGQEKAVCDATGEVKCYTPVENKKHYCDCVGVWDSELKKAVKKCDLKQKDTTAGSRRLDGQDTCVDFIICKEKPGGDKKFCFTPDPTGKSTTVCDCNKQHTDNGKQLLCDTKNVLVTDEPVASQTAVCEGGIGPILWKNFNGFAG